MSTSTLPPHLGGPRTWLNLAFWKETDCNSHIAALALAPTDRRSPPTTIKVVSVERRAMILHLRLFLCLASLTALAQTAAAQIGSGTIGGAFSDAQPTLPPEVLIVPLVDPPAGQDWATPRSMGSGTDQYGWGMWETGKFFLDGIETPFEDIIALELSDEELNARVRKEVGPSANALRFTGLDFVDQPRGETFVAGRLFYHNGVNAFGTSVSSVNFDVQSSSVSPDFSQLLSLKIAIRSSPNVLNPDGTLNNEASADFIFFVGRPDLGSFRVFEQQGTDVEILMEFNSLDLIGFGAVGDPAVGFISSSVPEPSTLLLFGMAGLGLFRIRHR